MLASQTVPHRRRAVVRIVLGTAFATAGLVGLAAAAATSAGQLPAPGIWDYNSARGNTSFSGFLEVSPGNHKSGFREMNGVVFPAMCKQNGRVRGGNLVAFGVNGYTKIVIVAKPDGSFSASMRSGSGYDVHRGATFTVKGVVRGRFVSGKVTAHDPHHPYGDCKGTGTFTRVRGVPIVG